eukprot:gene964-280_t
MQFLSAWNENSDLRKFLDREEALTEFMMAWNKRKILKLPKDLCTRYLKTNKELLIVSEKIESAFKEMSITETDAETGLNGNVLRKLISKEKATLSLFIDSYESCLQLNDPYSIMTKKIKEDILAGNFPWRRVHELSGNVDIADKRLIVQWCLVCDRLSEEKNIIIKEMHSYLSHYKDVVMPNLEKEQRDIAEGLWNCLGSDSNKDNHQEDNKMRYQPADLRKDVLSGIHAVLSRGRAFAAQKISNGMF